MREVLLLKRRQLNDVPQIIVECIVDNLVSMFYAGFNPGDGLPEEEIMTVDYLSLINEPDGFSVLEDIYREEFIRSPGDFLNKAHQTIVSELGMIVENNPEFFNVFNNHYQAVDVDLINSDKNFLVFSLQRAVL